MFYAHFVLSKRGPLARIWLAAHWDKKLTKAHVFETNLEASVETIISPQVKMALRTSGHLLLGVVRIYNRKAKYLLADCNEAFVKIKMAFRPGVVDLPEDSREAPRNQIYLVEEFQDFDAPLPDISEINMSQNLTTNQSRLEEITMRDDVPTSFQMDEGFGGGLMGFGKEVDQFSSGDLENMFFKEDNRKLPGTSKDGLFGMDGGGLDGGIGGGGALDDNFMQGPGLFGEGENFLDEATNKPDEMVIDAPGSPMDQQVMSPSAVAKETPQEMDTAVLEQPQLETVDTGQIHMPEPTPADMNALVPPSQDQPEESFQQPQIALQQQPEPNEADTTFNQNETTLIATEEAFALEPLDITGVKDTRIRRKRKLIVDPVIELDGQTMREQLKNFEDIVTTLDLAPPTKRLMQWKEIGGVDKLFAAPTYIYAQAMNKAFSSNLHCEVPETLKDLSATQLNKRFGGQDETTTPSEIDESSIQVARDISNANQMPPAPILEDSSILQNKQHEISNAQPNLADASFQQPIAYNSDADDYEPYSDGPPSPGSSPGGMMPPLTSPPKVPDQASALESLGMSDISGIPPAEEPEPDPEIEESESYAEDVDDLRWNKRTQQLIHTFNRSFKHAEQLSFFQMTEGAFRKQAASKFYSLLVLAKQEACQLHQSESFSDIFIKKGPRFESVLM